MPDAKNGAHEAADVFRISRTFDVPRDLLFRIWTEPEHMKHWWGPKGFTVKKCDIDLRVGGAYHYCLAYPNGEGEMWGKFVFREIEPPVRLHFNSFFSDKDGGMTVHPMMPDWPREMLTTITFDEHNGKTTVQVEWKPINASEKEWKTFRDNLKGMDQGWGGTFEQLADYLATNPSAS